MKVRPVFVVINHQVSHMRVHVDGCVKLARDRKRANGEFTVEWGTEQEILEDIWQDFADEMDLDEMREETLFCQCLPALDQPKAEPTAGAYPPALSGCLPETYALACQVRAKREAGLPWWQVGHQLGLQGSGPSAATGKTGAAAARRLWMTAWGKTWDTVAPGAVTVRPTQVTVPPVNGKKPASVEPVRPAPLFSSADDPDHIRMAVADKEITWTARLGDVETTQSAIVADTKSLAVKVGRYGLYIDFFEQVGHDSRTGRPVLGQQRAVYVAGIHHISGYFSKAV